MERRIMAATQLTTNQKVGGIVGGIIGLVVVLVVFNGGWPFGGASVERQLENMAKGLNPGLPKQTDAVTRWDRVEAGPGKSCAYIYTVSINLTDSQKEEIKKSVTAKMKADPATRAFFDAGVTVWFKYYNAAGKSMLEFPVTK
jgi:hypothetical protein